MFGFKGLVDRLVKLPLGAKDADKFRVIIKDLRHILDLGDGILTGLEKALDVDSSGGDDIVLSEVKTIKKEVEEAYKELLVTVKTIRSMGEDNA